MIPMIGTFLGKLLDRYLFRQVQPRLSDRRTPPEELDAQRHRDLAAELRVAVGAPAPASVDLGAEHNDPRVGLAYRPVTLSPPGVVGRLYGEANPDNPAVLFIHGWLQPSYISLSEMAALLVRRGLSVFILELPHHLSRRPPGEAHGARFVSGDLKITLDSLVRATAEVSAAAAWLRGLSGGLSTMGFSLGGLLAGLHTCLAEEPPDRVVLVAPAARPAEILLGSPLADRVRRAVFDQGVTPREIRRVMAQMDLTRLRPRTAPERVFLVAGRGDRAVPVSVMRGLRDRWGCRYREVSAGHVSLWLPLMVGERLGFKRGLSWCRGAADFLEGAG
jgi:pimeloyl-ACP methyl ester carboxylesterase